MQTGSDCEVINALYRDDADIGAWLNRLNGIFAFALWDESRQRCVIARDPIGVCPMYWGHDARRPLVGGVGNEGAGAACATTWRRSRRAITTTATPAH